MRPTHSKIVHISIIWSFLFSLVWSVVKYSAVFTFKLSSGFRVNIPLRLLGRFILLSELVFKAVCRLRQTSVNGLLLAHDRNVIFVTIRQFFFSINACILEHKMAATRKKGWLADHKLAQSDPRFWTSGLEEPMDFMEAKMNFKKVSSDVFLCWMTSTSRIMGTFSTYVHVKLSLEPSFSI